MTAIQDLDFVAPRDCELESYGVRHTLIRAGERVCLADLIYVAVGAALELGIPLGAVWAEVHTANMRKVGGGRRGDGKVLKPEGWTPPDVIGAVFGKRP